MRVKFPAALLWMGTVAAVAGPAIGGLDARGPAAEWADRLMLFGQFAGDWVCDVTLILPGGSRRQGTCEWHFGWTLEGRAIQDVWMAHYGEASPGTAPDAIGTTIRWYDPKAEVWHAEWINARDNVTHTFLARKVGEEIVLDGQDHADHPHRWVFSQITPRSFQWRSEDSRDGGKTWVIGQEMRARRSVRDAESDRRAIERLEQEWLAAEGSTPVLERILADDFVHPVPAGVFLTKRQHIEWAEKHPAPAGRKARFSRLDVRLYGDTAIATGIVENTDASGGDRRRTIFTDVFAFRNGAWQAVNGQENGIGRPQ